MIEADTPARALLDFAHEHGFDLIICGHNHTRRAGRLLPHDIAGDLDRQARTPGQSPVSRRVGHHPA